MPAKMKSFSTLGTTNRSSSGTYGSPLPGPAPNSPPVPSPSNDATNCNPESSASANGSSHTSTRAAKLANGPAMISPIDQARNAPPKNSTRPMINQLDRSVATYRVATNMPKYMSDVPRSRSKTRTTRD